ncbi:hypothetical protein Rsub_07024 [Raphidocelis subcapitata]|uniref:Urease accessory protein UreH-like transmembrane domain-containing protein n=1 Tax=Raphidocelis subcapitata TaxID=307507 RepID=A0A2V0P9F8_9CHLO|nr:hypothetical protein Rsub_07024 [Raphidocelis subcapitata]|eukprot:GBF94490.1 hypothetical protein Rsub_07024 [Raphidocelis subcapitata]
MRTALAIASGSSCGALPVRPAARLHAAPKVVACPHRGRRAIGGGQQQRQGPLRSPAANAVGSAAAFPLQPDADTKRLQHLCKSVLVGVAAAAAWSIAASALSGAGGPFASLSLASSGGSSAAAQEAAKSGWAGLAAGFLHTLCGPDHLAALTPLTIGRNRAAAAALGALWGFGHSTGQLILGLALVLLKERFHDFIPALSRWSGVVVGLTLIAIGLMGLYETYFESDHGHEEEASAAAKAAASASMDAPALAAAGAGGGVAPLRQGARVGWATYATGIVYGLQPDALFVVVPALALPTKLAAVAYCSMFVLGTVAAMGGYTAVIGTTSAALTKERPWLQDHLSSIASAVAIIVGVLVLASGFGLELPFMHAH